MTSSPMPQCDFESEKLVVRLDMTIPADVEAITPVVDRVMTMVGEFGCGKGHEFAIEMALREALANAVIHGAKHDPEKQVEFCVACDAERGMLIVVRSPGEGFDPAKLPSPVVGQQIYSEHGRGIFLINQLMDEVRFEKGGTEIHMRKY